MTGPGTFSLTLPDEAATAHLMADLALLVGAGDIITLSGDLGAGKTTAARAMIRYLADDEELEVPSPTFTLVQAYDLLSIPLLHADLYRISDASELEEIGLQPFPDATVVLIEWPERAGDALPPDRIDIAFSHSNELGAEARTVEITGHGKAAAQVERLRSLRQFLEKAGFGEAKRRRMAGEAVSLPADLVGDEGDHGRRMQEVSVEVGRLPLSQPIDQDHRVHAVPDQGDVVTCQRPRRGPERSPWMAAHCAKRARQRAPYAAAPEVDDLRHQRQRFGMGTMLVRIHDRVQVELLELLDGRVSLSVSRGKLKID